MSGMINTVTKDVSSMAPKTKRPGSTSTSNSSRVSNSGNRNSGATRRNVGGMNSDLI
jgi:hypothetical protein